MCEEDITKTCKQRFKGIENFLRRIAFNLGNTASQTEVKIISCIPIDVTDFQQKIISLEKELQNVKGASSNRNSSPPDVCKREKTADKTAAFNTSFPGPSIRSDTFCSNSKTKLNKESLCGICPFEQRNSNISFVFSALSVEDPCGIHKKNIEDIQCSRTEENKRGNIFRRRKKNKVCTQRNIPKTHLVYYAQAPNIPFCSTFSKNINKEAPKKKRDLLSEHFSKIMRKQYDPGFSLEEFSDTSQFTRPICKDVNTPVRYDSDVCSCCHGRFKNVDNYMGKGADLVTEPGLSYKFQKYNTQTYYNSKFYDIVPVKEVTGKLKKDLSRKIEANNKHTDMNSWSKKTRSKQENNYVTVNYRAEIHPSSKRPYYNKITQKNNNPPPPLSCLNKQKRIKINEQMHEDSSRSLSVNCGDIYPKRVRLSKGIEKREQSVTNIRESHIIVNINSIDNHVKTTKSIQLEVDLLNETKTETMLNQIKSILQSVLTEVKINTQLNKEEKPKKDAVVQKGSSQNNMPGCSRLLNSITYNSANNGNSYYSPCSQPYMPSGLCFPYQPVKCMQSTPYYIQPCQARYRCFCQCNKANSCYKADKPATVATNTGGENSTGLETSNLIKEIYKSVALNLDYPTKDNSNTDYDTLKSAYVKTKKSVTDDARSVNESDVVKTDKEIEALLTTCTETSSQSEEKDTKETTTGDIITDTERIAANRHLYHLYRYEERNNRENDTIKEQEETVESNSEVSDTTVVQRVEDGKIKKGKKGFFNRIAKLLQRRKVAEPPNDNNREDEGDTESSEESETDDYETVYSGSANQSQYHSPPPQRQTYVKNTPHINIQVNGKRIRRSPYMEQEHRQHWNGDLTSQERGQRYYPGRPGTSRSMRLEPRYTPYRRNYEARSVIIDNRHNEYIKNQDAKQTCKLADEKVGFLKKHKLGLRCGEQWKKLILEN